MDRYELLIGGEWESSHSGRYDGIVNPSDGSNVAQFALADKADMDRAVDQARDAFEKGEWSGLSCESRAAVLRKAAEMMTAAADELARLEMANCGKPIRQASFFDIPIATACMQYYGTLQPPTFRKRVEQPDYPGTYGIIDHEPYGVVGAIVPWNVPLLMASWKVAPALLAGNSVVLKPSRLTPLTALKLGKILYEAGLPRGTLSVITGGGSEVGAELAANNTVDAISFTGSTDTGKEIMRLASGNAKKVLLELGGKSPNIVLDDADLDMAVKGAMFAVFLHSGQLCESGTRLLLSDRIYDRFLSELKARTNTMRLGLTDSMETDVGPLISKEQLSRVESYIEIGLKEGAHQLCGGHVDSPALRGGYYVKPTIFTEVQPQMRIAQEEIFGPVLSVMRFMDEEELVEMANDTIYGLAAAVWSKDVERALEIGRRIRAGTVWINDFHALTTYAPRGGYKQSGFGRELGEEGLHEYLQTKHYFVNENGELEETAYSLVNATS